MRVDMPEEIPTHPPTMSLSITSGSSATAIGLSGMRAAQRQLDSHAHNVANVQTPEFKRQVSAPLDGLANDLVGQRISLYSFAANLRTVQTEDRMLGALLDTRT